jgi:uncharacterized membrane protein YccC
MRVQLSDDSQRHLDRALAAEAALAQAVKERNAAEDARRWSREQYENLRTLELERIAALERALAQARAALEECVMELDAYTVNVGVYSAAKAAIRKARALLAPPDAGKAKTEHDNDCSLGKHGHPYEGVCDCGFEKPGA